LLHLC